MSHFTSYEVEVQPKVFLNVFLEKGKQKGSMKYNLAAVVCLTCIDTSGYKQDQVFNQVLASSLRSIILLYSKNSSVFVGYKKKKMTMFCSLEMCNPINKQKKFSFCILSFRFVRFQPDLQHAPTLQEHTDSGKLG